MCGHVRKVFTAEVCKVFTAEQNNPAWHLLRAGASTASGPSRDAPSDASRAGASRPPPDRVSGIRADLSRWGRTRPLVDQEYIRVLPVR